MSFATPEACRARREWDEFRDWVKREDEYMDRKLREANEESLKSFEQKRVEPLKNELFG